MARSSSSSSHRSLSQDLQQAQSIANNHWRSSSNSPTSSPPPFRLTFICLGNICRSPAAEAIFHSLLAASNQSTSFSVDSCGLGGIGGSSFYRDGYNCHEGALADDRMIAVSSRRGYSFDKCGGSTVLSKKDITEMNLLVAMSPSIRDEMVTAAAYWDKQGGGGEEYYSTLVRDKTVLMRCFCSGVCDETVVVDEAVPDPYYGGKQGFDDVLDILEDACGNMLNVLRRNQQH
eukprot:GHVS01104473.1.p1 GENE.GHVS01104473.1~~GHVS01104473.1.p1  ORF type:complete len:248 (+),score=67.50 GHVS01104473.1:49-744(+)